MPDKPLFIWFLTTNSHTHDGVIGGEFPYGQEQQEFTEVGGVGGEALC